MYRHLGSFPLPLSAVLSLAVIIMGASVGATLRDADAQGLGWAVALIGIAALLISLSRMLWLAVAENRVQYMSRVAREAIEEAGRNDLDAELRNLTKDGRPGGA